VMVGGMVMAFIGGLHFWWPKITGRMYNQWTAQFAAIVTFIGFNLTFFPQFIVGYLGMPRRYHVYPEEWQVLHTLSTAGASVLGFGFLLMMIYLPYAAFFGKKASSNPWRAKGLEWEIPSPPPPENFTEIPEVTQEAYAYAD